MPFANLGASELLIIALIVLLLFGARRIPDVAASFGKGIREFKRSLSHEDSAVERAVTRRRPPEGADH